jgi:tetratricopeptide (TPR) repeat protein
MKYLLLICLVIVTLIGAAQAQDNIQKAVAFNDQGVAAYEAKNYESATGLFAQALQLHPGYATAYYNLGTTYLNMKQLEKAAGAFQKAISFYPAYA